MCVNPFGPLRVAAVTSGTFAHSGNVTLFTTGVACDFLEATVLLYVACFPTANFFTPLALSCDGEHLSTFPTTTVSRVLASEPACGPLPCPGTCASVGSGSDSKHFWITSLCWPQTQITWSRYTPKLQLEARHQVLPDILLLFLLEPDLCNENGTFVR